MMLVSLQEASPHVRRDTDADDADLLLKIRGASNAVFRHIDAGSIPTDSNGDVLVDSNGVALDVEDDIKLATLLMIAEVYANRGDGKSSFDGWQLPNAVKTLLMPFRTPTAV